MKHFIKWLVRVTKPWVWRIAEAYDLRVDRPCFPYGQHPVIIEGGDFQVRNIPKSVYFNTRSGKIVVGKNSIFGEGVLLLTGKHMNMPEAITQGAELHHVPDSGRDILIGTGCYIGSGAILIGPVVIGDYAVIGAGAVVTHNVAASTFVAGNPARLIRNLS